MFKIETHLHTVYCSACGEMSAQQIVEGYRQAGYAALIVTDHFNRDTFRMLQRDTREKGEHLHAFLEGYRRVREAAEPYGIRVYRGAEVRFDGRCNDYLVYGFSDELLRDPEAVFTMGAEAFYEKCKQDGALLIHAHPYRDGGTPTSAAALDGAEVANMHPGHKNRNALALAFAEENGLIKLAGSDCHEPCHLGRGGILVDALPRDERDLVELLRSGNYALFEKST